MAQDLLLSLYRRATRLVFNLVVVALLIGLFVGLVRTFSELGLTVTEPTVRLGLKDLVTNVLSLVIVLELVRVFVEYFDWTYAASTCTGNRGLKSRLSLPAMSLRRHW
jgi:uncharacterized membrane protein (DUF373 family)